MILRTPPPRKRRADSSPSAAASDDDHHHHRHTPDRPLVIYQSPSAPESSHDPSSDQMLCTYQCRQMVKSEFLDALGSAEKQVHDFQSRLEALNDELRKSEIERKEFRDQFCYAEQELAAVKGREKALQEQLMKEVTDSQERVEKQIKSYSELEVKLKKEVTLRKTAESSAVSANEKARVLEERLSHLSDSIDREKKHLQSELSQLKKESNLSVSRISADLERVECRASSAEKESELLTEQLENLKKHLDESLRQKNEMANKLLSFSSQSQEVTPMEINILVKNLQEELKNYESEVREARRLKSSHENNELLKVKLLEEQSRRERAESGLLELQEVHVRVKESEDELMAWKSILKEIPGVSCRDDIPVKFAGLQKEVLENMAKVGEVTARLKQIEVTLEASELDKQQAEAEARLAKEKAAESMLEVKRLDMLLGSVSEERDRLRNNVKLLKQTDVEPDGEPKNAALIEELEASLAKKESSIKDLESRLCEHKEVICSQHNEINLLTEKLNIEARKIKSLEREDDRLRSEISILESKLGLGDFSAASTKVLRMVNTLAVDNEAKQTIETLRNELQKAKEKLQAVQELQGKSADAGNLIDSDISEKLAQLKGQIATLEKREERYKTVFAEKITVFRRACCSLFGYKIVMDEHQRPNGIPVTRFSLQSIYSSADDEKLEFEYESGNTTILANDYASQPEISQQVEIFIRKLNSIPAFTANLTVESFNKRTFS